VWVANYDWMHVNITLIGGSDGLLMVDTHGSAAEARIVATTSSTFDTAIRAVARGSLTEASPVCGMSGPSAWRLDPSREAGNAAAGTHVAGHDDR